jgi:hypothetical protein
VLPETATPEQAPDVLGEQAFASNDTNQAQPQSQQELPTSVNAGVSGPVEQGPGSGTTLLGLLLVLLGVVSGRLAWSRTRG